MYSELFKYKSVDFKKLIPYGFIKSGEKYTYQANITDKLFTLTISINSDGKLQTKLTETETGEIYTLHLVKSADGEFVGKIREEYEKILKDIIENCYRTEIFKNSYTKKVLEYAYKKYHTEPEYLWKKFPDNAVLRRADTQKWYGAVLTVGKEKFGFNETCEVEVINLHAKPENITKLLLEKNIYPAYHMNKKHWFTIILDGTVELKKIYKLIDESYKLAKK